MKKKLVSVLLAGMMAVAPMATTVATPIVAICEEPGSIPTNTGELAENPQDSTIINAAGGVVTDNNGTINTNQEGSVVTNNNGTVETNVGTVVNNEGTISTNIGRVDVNDVGGQINSSVGVVGTNKGTIGTAGAGSVVESNEGTVNYLAGGIVVNTESGKVERNLWGTVEGGRVDYNFAGLGAIANTDDVGLTYWKFDMTDEMSKWKAYCDHDNINGVTSVVNNQDGTQIIDHFLGENTTAYIQAKNWDVEEIISLVLAGDSIGTANVVNSGNGIWQISGITNNIRLIPTYAARIIEQIISVPTVNEEVHEEQHEVVITEDTPKEEVEQIVAQVVQAREEAAKVEEAKMTEKATAEVKIADVKTTAVDESGKALSVSVSELPVSYAKSQMTTAIASIDKAIKGDVNTLKVFKDAGIDVSKIKTENAKVVAASSVVLPKTGSVTLDMKTSSLKVTDVVMAVFTDINGKVYYAPIKINADGTITVKVPVKNCAMSIIKF